MLDTKNIELDNHIYTSAELVHKKVKPKKFQNFSIFILFLNPIGTSMLMVQA